MTESGQLPNGDMPFSVVMPVYFKDDPQYVDQALESLRIQTLLPNEVVIVLDGPIPESLSTVIKKFVSERSLLIRIVALEKNMGLAHALNEGLNQSAYEWVARMDSDDICDPQRFEKQIAYLKAHPEVDVVGADIKEFYHKVNDLSIFRRVPSTHEDILRLSRFRCPINHVTVLYKKSRVMQAGGYESVFGTFEDYPMWVKMLQGGTVFHNLPLVLMHVRVADMSMIRRRKGLQYAHKEWLLANYFFRIRHVNIWQYGIWIFLRIPARLIPSRLLRFVYHKVLRKSN